MRPTTKQSTVATKRSTVATTKSTDAIKRNTHATNKKDDVVKDSLYGVPLPKQWNNQEWIDSELLKRKARLVFFVWMNGSEVDKLKARSYIAARPVDRYILYNPKHMNSPQYINMVEYIKERGDWELQIMSPPVQKDHYTVYIYDNESKTVRKMNLKSSPPKQLKPWLSNCYDEGCLYTMLQSPQSALRNYLHTVSMKASPGLHECHLELVKESKRLLSTSNKWTWTS